MTQSPTERRSKDFLPVNKVVTVLETKETADNAITVLMAAGFAENDIYLHHGEQGQQYIDADGSRHGFLAKLVRVYQRLQGIEKRMLDDAEAGLNAGHYLIGVQTDGSEEQQIKGRDALAAFTDQHIYFCGRFTITILEFAKEK
ncbi:MAG: hypothetical protein GY805_12135 [Chloroflexi bacterium]|nr:hypothetical protein [Chloroflexota bacterium]